MCFSFHSNISHRCHAINSLFIAMVTIVTDCVTIHPGITIYFPFFCFCREFNSRLMAPVTKITTKLITFFRFYIKMNNLPSTSNCLEFVLKPIIENQSCNFLLLPWQHTTRTNVNRDSLLVVILFHVSIGSLYHLHQVHMYNCV